MLVYKCLVCGYDEMPSPPEDYNICPCCGVEYAVDDVFDSYRDLREDWLAAGAKWFSRHPDQRPPINWDAWEQLDLANYEYSIPSPLSNSTTTFSQQKRDISGMRSLIPAGVTNSYA